MALKLLAVLAFSFAAFFYLRSTYKLKDTALKRLETPSDIVLGEEKCSVRDEIEYQYYAKQDKTSKIQDNIGYTNNKIGLYIYSTTNFIKKADELINSNGGDWGYVLIPYNVKDYDTSKWEEIFELLSKKHLIPIIQLWDVSPEDYKEQTEEAAKFLNKFPWPIEKKYVSAYNEVNDSRFWKGNLDPAGYARVLNFTIDTFKKRDPNFFMLNGAFNATAPNGGGYMEEVRFMTLMNETLPGIFGKLDGWASHSYPQPAFRGSPKDIGRGSIRAYEWELSVLKQTFGVEGLPVFITETGWPHAEGKTYNPFYHDADTVSRYIKTAFEDVWLKDDRVVAVTPFTVYYDPPFDHFSFVKKDGGVYPQFTALKDLKKTAGRPKTLKNISKDIIICP